MSARNKPDATVWRVNLDRDLIERAEQGSSTRCMQALGIREQIPGAWSINVSAELIRFNVGDERYAFPQPAKTAALVAQFDDDKARVPEHVLVLDKRRAFTAPVVRRPHVKRGPTKKRSKPSARRCVRRYHGLRVVEIREAA